MKKPWKIGTKIQTYRVYGTVSDKDAIWTIKGYFEDQVIVKVKNVKGWKVGL